MGSISKVILIVILLAVVGGGIFLVTWEIPAPTAKVERVLPNDRFPN